MRIPRTQRELQEVLGKLNWASKFCPHHWKVARPLKQLLRKESDGEWTADCTAALNHLLDLAAAQLRLQIAREDLPYRMYISLDDCTGGVLLG